MTVVGIIIFIVLFLIFINYLFKLYYESQLKSIDNMKEKKDIDGLIQVLKNKKKYFDVRTKAAAALGSFEDAKAVYALIEALEDKSGTPGDWEYLERKKKLDDLDIRTKAAESLGKIGDSIAVAALSRILKDDKELKRLRKASRDAIIKIGGPEFNFEFYEKWINVITNDHSITLKKITILSQYLNNPLAQGVKLMYKGAEALDYNLFIEGLKLCKSAQFYEWSTIKPWVDHVASIYIEEFKKLNEPIGKIVIGPITGMSPINQKEKKSDECPNCGKKVEQVVVKGQTVKCDRCDSVFQIS